MDNENIMVSVCCIVYNHEKYLRQCLDGIIMQKTNFKFEVLVHDDASSDGSPNIIREYEQKYPDIIRPIYQSENQYSKGVNVSWTFQYPSAKGKYIALCEGDDYWCDEYKLQKQYDRLEASGASLCTHAVRYIYEDGKKSKNIKPNPVGNDKYIKSKDFLRSMFLENNIPFQTSCYFMRKTCFSKFGNIIPEFVMNCGVGDVPLLLLSGNEGDVCYIAEEMSCYRKESNGSWSQVMKKNRDKQINHEAKLILSYEAFDKYTCGRYRKEIDYAILRCEYNILVLEGKYRMFSRKPYRQFYMQLDRKNRLYKMVDSEFPILLKLYKLIKDIVRVDRVGLY